MADAEKKPDNSDLLADLPPIPDVDLEEDEPIEVRNETDDPPEPVKQPEQAPEEDIRATLAKMREENERLKAERQAEQRRAMEAAKERDATNVQYLEMAAQKLVRDQDALKAAYAEAAQNGDWTAAADVQAKMATLAQQAVILQNGIEAAKTNPRKYMPERDPVEEKAAQMLESGSPASADWIRRNPEWARDERKFQRVVGAHYIAVGEGIAPDTPEYFRRVESVLGIGQAASQAPAQPDPVSVAAQPVKAPPAAPASPNGAGPGQRRNQVRMSREEAEFSKMLADSLGQAGFKVSPEDYAREKLRLEKEGKR